MATNIKTLTESNGDILIPRTTTTAITVTGSGENLDTKLSNIKDDIDTKISAIGGITEEPIPRNADTLNGYDSNHYASKSEVSAQLAEIENDLSDKAQKLKATNLLTNGDFSQGTKGWEATYASTAANESGRLAITATNQYGYRGQQFLTIAGNKYYFAGTIEGTTNNYLIVQGIGTTSKVTPSNGIHRLSGDFIATGASHTISAGDLRTSGWTKFWFDNVIIIDLTATFGAGNEPTKEQMDRLLAEFPNSWFDGTQEILPLKVLPQLLDEKANKAQENWITPTLLNGWTGDLQYYKDSLGLVHVIGSIRGGNSFTPIYYLPTGYRPSTTIYQVITGRIGEVLTGDYNVVRQLWIQGATQNRVFIPSVISWSNVNSMLYFNFTYRAEA